MAGRGGDGPLPELPQNAAANSRAKTVKEHKRINALNLEPGISKTSEGLSSNSGGGMKDVRSTAKSSATDMKKEFSRDLQKIKAQEAQNDHKKGRTPSTADNKAQGSIASVDGKFPVNQAPMGNAQFKWRTDSPFLKQGLQDLLEPYFQNCLKTDVMREDARWPNTGRQSYQEALGKPDPNNQAHTKLMQGMPNNMQGMQAMQSMQQMPAIQGMQNMGMQGMQNMQGMQGMQGAQQMPMANSTGSAQAQQWQGQQGQAAPSQQGGQMMHQNGYPQQMQQMYHMQQGGGGWGQQQMQQMGQMQQQQQPQQQQSQQQQQQGGQNAQQNPQQQQWVMIQPQQNMTGPGGQMQPQQMMGQAGMMNQGMMNQGMMVPIPVQQGGCGGQQQGQQQGQMMVMPMMMGGMGGQQIMMMPNQGMMMQPMGEQNG